MKGNKVKARQGMMGLGTVENDSVDLPQET